MHFSPDQFYSRSKIYFEKKGTFSYAFKKHPSFNSIQKYILHAFAKVQRQDEVTTQKA